MIRRALPLSLLMVITLRVASSGSVENNKAYVDETRFINLLERVEKLETKEIHNEAEISSLKEENKQQHLEIIQLRTLLESRDETTSSQSSISKGSYDGGEDELGNISTIPYQEGNIDARHEVKRNRIRRTENEMDVAFFAGLSHQLTHLGQNQNVQFDNVVTNIGNAYNAPAGVFVAPVDGTYVFSVTLMAGYRNSTHFGFALNGHRVTWMHLNGQENAYDTTSQTIILQLRKGDDVSIQHSETDKSLEGGNQCLFSGFLLLQSYANVNVVG